MPSPLAQGRGLPVQAGARFLVPSGSPASYRLSADRDFHKTISVVRILARRLVPLLAAKRLIEELVVGEQVAVDIPMIEDAAASECELAEPGVRALPCEPELQAADPAGAKSRRR